MVDLPAPFGPEQRHRLPGGHAQVDARDRLRGAESPPQALDVENRCRWHGSSFSWWPFFEVDQGDENPHPGAFRFRPGEFGAGKTYRTSFSMSMQLG